jgi:hypothetical protein
VRRAVAALTFALVAFLHAIDPVMCPDGCTDEDRPTQSTPAPVHNVPSACLLCHGSLIAGPELPAAPASVVADAFAVEPDTVVVSQPVRRIEHPPRS